FRGTPYSGQPNPQGITKIGYPSLRQGLIFGSTLGVACILLDFASYLPIVGGLLGLLTFYILLLFFFVFCLLAGKRASKVTGKIRTGTIAGLWTSFIADIGLLLGASVLHTLHYVHGLNLVELTLLGLIGGAIGGTTSIKRAK
ncbi:MAG TPA: hypothetical protein VJ761_06015, partial [Ktedonobacteraceae bacterium]|nr:hypothetical protein [Ktedonobacteraceae bacterium]